jgi:hypothetical protein
MKERQRREAVEKRKSGKGHPKYYAKWDMRNGTPKNMADELILNMGYRM